MAGPPDPPPFALALSSALWFLVSTALAANHEGSYVVRRIPADKWAASAEGAAFRHSKEFARSAKLRSFLRWGGGGLFGERIIK